MVKEEQSDKYIELSTFSRLLGKMKADFEFDSVKDLKLETFPIHKMLTRILNYRLNLYPTSIRGLETYKRATELKQTLMNKFLEANKNPIEYASFENNILSLLTESIKSESLQSAQTFIYWLENLLEMGFEDVFTLLNRFGIGDLATFKHVQELDAAGFHKDVKLLQLRKWMLLS